MIQPPAGIHPKHRPVYVPTCAGGYEWLIPNQDSQSTSGF
jgi:hypothetical protein